MTIPPAKTPPAKTPPAMRTGRAAPALLADALCVLLFVAIGRRNHAEGVTLAGVAQTAWPFLTGLAAGWVINRAWRRPMTIWPTAVGIWLITVAIGMGVRAGIGEGIAISFVLVATAFTGALLLGWRAVLAGLTRRRSGNR